MGEYKRQHTITKGYLRGFADDETPNTLWRYKKNDGSCEAKSVESATVKFHAYSIRKSDGNWNHVVERRFAEIEAEAIPLLPKLAAGATMTHAERYSLSFFIATIIRRPAALIEHFQQSFLSYRNDPLRLLAFFDTLRPRLELKYSQEEICQVREAIERGGFELPVEQAKAQQLSVWMAHLPEYVDIIASMHWQVWRAIQGFRFLTSDAPAFVRRHANDRDLGVVGIARADLGAELIIPITKNSLLIAAHQRQRPLCKATKTRIRELNAMIVRMAHKYVFSGNNSEDAAMLVTQNASFSAPLPDLRDVIAINDGRHGLSYSEPKRLEEGT